MPCQYHDEIHDLAEAREELNRVTRLLCELCEFVDKQQLDEVVFHHVSDELRQWWENHKEEDRKRKFREDACRQEAETKLRALKKLTREERAVLRLDPLLG